jgi:hypothetical protein
MFLGRHKRWAVCWLRGLRTSYFLPIAFLLIASVFPASGQGLRTVIDSRDKVFPDVTAGVMAIKHDSSDRYYILAKPETVISVYAEDGKLIGRIPNSKSGGATIRYAVDIDITPGGLLAVADRGTNAILVFSSDGSFVSRTPVAAPTSVVALADDQFAVTTLTSKRLVEIIDVRGKVLRSFGDPLAVSDPPADAPAENKPPVNMGRILGDSSGGIYYAFTTVPDPTVRKYDKYGYLGYEASIPARTFGQGPTQPNDRVEVSFGFSDVSFSNQTQGSVTFGSSSDVQFSGGVGTGLAEQLRSGMGFNQAIQQQTMPNAFGGGGSMGATFSGEVTNQGKTDFQLGFGRMAGGGRGRRSYGSFNDQSNSQGAALHFSSTGDDSSDSDFGGSSGFDSSSMTAQLQMNSSDSDSSIASDPGPGAYNSPPVNLGPGGLPGSFVLGTRFDNLGFRHPFPNSTANPFGATATTNSAGSSTPSRPGPGGHSAGSGGAGMHYGDFHGRFGQANFAFTSSMRVNLGDLGRVSAFDKPIITAMAADPETHEIWAGIGDTLVHFSREGDPIGIYYLVFNGSTPLKPAAVLIEPDRFLIAADPWGIFEFARPDKPHSQPKQDLTVVPQVVAHPQ